MATIEEGSWTPGPQRPLLAAGAVHVWRADLDAVSDDVGRLLSGDEQSRAERFASARDAERWRRSRGLLRALLGRYLRRQPAALRFVVGEHGKPTLADDARGASTQANSAPAPAAAALELNFNMSHSGHLALYAFSRAGAVGVDVEVARHVIDEVAIASRTLGADAARRLQALAPPDRRRQFLRAWARHEAQLKCLGVGIGGAAAAEHALWVVELELEPNAAAALAAERPARELCCWAWRP